MVKQLLTKIQVWWHYRKLKARGQQLDKIAELHGLCRKPFEFDGRFRKRIIATMKGTGNNGEATK